MRFYSGLLSIVCLFIFGCATTPTTSRPNLTLGRAEQMWSWVLGVKDSTPVGIQVDATTGIIQAIHFPTVCLDTQRSEEIITCPADQLGSTRIMEDQKIVSFSQSIRDLFKNREGLKSSSFIFFGVPKGLLPKIVHHLSASFNSTKKPMTMDVPILLAANKTKVFQKAEYSQISDLFRKFTGLTAKSDITEFSFRVFSGNWTALTQWRGWLFQLSGLSPVDRVGLGGFTPVSDWLNRYGLEELISAQTQFVSVLNSSSGSLKDLEKIQRLKIKIWASENCKRKVRVEVRRMAQAWVQDGLVSESFMKIFEGKLSLKQIEKKYLGNKKTAIDLTVSQWNFRNIDSQRALALLYLETFSDEIDRRSSPEFDSLFALILQAGKERGNAGSSAFTDFTQTPMLDCSITE